MAQARVRILAQLLREALDHFARDSSSARAHRSEADTLLKQIRSGTELTWNEPGSIQGTPIIVTMIVGAIIGTGIICALR